MEGVVGDKSPRLGHGPLLEVADPVAETVHAILAR